MEAKTLAKSILATEITECTERTKNLPEASQEMAAVPQECFAIALPPAVQYPPLWDCWQNFPVKLVNDG